MKIHKGLAIAAAWLLAAGIATGVHAADLASPAQEAAVTQACVDWMKPLDPSGAFSAQRVEGGMCLNGAIKTGDDKAVLDLLDGFDKAAALVVVVRSGGGEVNAAMAMGEAFLDRPVTVIAEQFCASSCANYLITAGHRRIVAPDTLLLYHGGIMLDQLDQILPQLREYAKTGPEMKVGDIFLEQYEDTVKTIERQEAFLIKAGISPTLFRWMDLLIHMTPEERARHCPAASVVTQYPPEVLARFGLIFDAYDAPATQAEVAAVAQKLGKTTAICLWRD